MGFKILIFCVFLFYSKLVASIPYNEEPVRQGTQKSGDCQDNENSGGQYHGTDLTRTHNLKSLPNTELLSNNQRQGSQYNNNFKYNSNNQQPQQLLRHQTTYDSGTNERQLDSFSSGDNVQGIENTARQHGINLARNHNRNSLQNSGLELSSNLPVGVQHSNTYGLNDQPRHLQLQPQPQPVRPLPEYLKSGNNEHRFRASPQSENYHRNQHQAIRPVNQYEQNNWQSHNRFSSSSASVVPVGSNAFVNHERPVNVAPIPFHNSKPQIPLRYPNHQEYRDYGVNPRPRDHQYQYGAEQPGQIRYVAPNSESRSETKSSSNVYQGIPRQSYFKSENPQFSEDYNRQPNNPIEAIPLNNDRIAPSNTEYNNGNKENADNPILPPELNNVPTNYENPIEPSNPIVDSGRIRYFNSRPDEEPYIYRENPIINSEPNNQEPISNYEGQNSGLTDAIQLERPNNDEYNVRPTNEDEAPVIPIDTIPYDNNTPVETYQVSNYESEPTDFGSKGEDNIFNIAAGENLEEYFHKKLQKQSFVIIHPDGRVEYVENLGDSPNNYVFKKNDKTPPSFPNSNPGDMPGKSDDSWSPPENYHPGHNKQSHHPNNENDDDDYRSKQNTQSLNENDKYSSSEQQPEKIERTTISTTTETDDYTPPSESKRPYHYYNLRQRHESKPEKNHSDSPSKHVPHTSPTTTTTTTTSTTPNPDDKYIEDFMRSLDNQDDDVETDRHRDCKHKSHNNYNHRTSTSSKPLTKKSQRKFRTTTPTPAGNNRHPYNSNNNSKYPQHHTHNYPNQLNKSTTNPHKDVMLNNFLNYFPLSNKKRRTMPSSKLHKTISTVFYSTAPTLVHTQPQQSDESDAYSTSTPNENEEYLQTKSDYHYESTTGRYSKLQSKSPRTKLPSTTPIPHELRRKQTLKPYSDEDDTYTTANANEDDEKSQTPLDEEYESSRNRQRKTSVSKLPTKISPSPSGNNYNPSKKRSPKSSKDSYKSKTFSSDDDTVSEVPDSQVRSNEDNSSPNDEQYSYDRPKQNIYSRDSDYPYNRKRFTTPSTKLNSKRAHSKLPSTTPIPRETQSVEPCSDEDDTSTTSNPNEDDGKYQTPPHKKYPLYNRRKNPVHPESHPKISPGPSGNNYKPSKQHSPKLSDDSNKSNAYSSDEDTASAGPDFLSRNNEDNRYLNDEQYSYDSPKRNRFKDTSTTSTSNEDEKPQTLPDDKYENTLYTRRKTLQIKKDSKLHTKISPGPTGDNYHASERHSPILSKDALNPDLQSHHPNNENDDDDDYRSKQNTQSLNENDKYSSSEQQPEKIERTTISTTTETDDYTPPSESKRPYHYYNLRRRHESKPEKNHSDSPSKHVPHTSPTTTTTTTTSTTPNPDDKYIEDFMRSLDNQDDDVETDRHRDCKHKSHNNYNHRTSTSSKPLTKKSQRKFRTTTPTPAGNNRHPYNSNNNSKYPQHHTHNYPNQLNKSTTNPHKDVMLNNFLNYFPLSNKKRRTMPSSKLHKTISTVFYSTAHTLVHTQPQQSDESDTYSTSTPNENKEYLQTKSDYHYESTTGRYSKLQSKNPRTKLPSTTPIPHELRRKQTLKPYSDEDDTYTTANANEDDEKSQTPLDEEYESSRNRQRKTSVSKLPTKISPSPSGNNYNPSKKRSPKSSKDSYKSKTFSSDDDTVSEVPDSQVRSNEDNSSPHDEQYSYDRPKQNIYSRDSDYPYNRKRFTTPSTKLNSKRPHSKLPLTTPIPRETQSVEPCSDEDDTSTTSNPNEDDGKYQTPPHKKYPLYNRRKNPVHPESHPKISPGPSGNNYKPSKQHSPKLSDDSNKSNAYSSDEDTASAGPDFLSRNNEDNRYLNDEQYSYDSPKRNRFEDTSTTSTSNEDEKPQTLPDDKYENTPYTRRKTLQIKKYSNLHTKISPGPTGDNYHASERHSPILSKDALNPDLKVKEILDSLSKKNEDNFSKNDNSKQKDHNSDYYKYPHGHRHFATPLPKLRTKISPGIFKVTTPIPPYTHNQQSIDQYSDKRDTTPTLNTKEPDMNLQTQTEDTDYSPTDSLSTSSNVPISPTYVDSDEFITLSPIELATENVKDASSRDSLDDNDNFDAIKDQNDSDGVINYKDSSSKYSDNPDVTENRNESDEILKQILDDNSTDERVIILEDIFKNMSESDNDGDSSEEKGYSKNGRDKNDKYDDTKTDHTYADGSNSNKNMMIDLSNAMVVMNKTSDKDYLHHLMSGDSKVNLFIFQMPCQEQAIKETCKETRIYPNGTCVEETVVTTWNYKDDPNPTVVSTKRSYTEDKETYY